jgi:NADH-quinone oxidoreductase subunit C
MNPVLKEVGDHVAAALTEDVVSVAQRLDELTVVVQVGSIAKVLAFLRDDDQCDFKCLVDI